MDIILLFEFFNSFISILSLIFEIPVNFTLLALFELKLILSINLSILLFFNEL